MKRRQIFRAQASKSQTGSSSRRFVNSGPVLPFNPASIPGCQLWLDAADSSSVAVNSSSNVLAWIDKSGNGRDATATGTPTYVTGGGINFNGSSYFLNQTFTMNLSQRSIFIVMQETSRTIYSGVFLLIPTPNSSNDHATNTGISVETTNGLYFVNETYASLLGNSTLLVKSIYNDTMNGTTGSGYLNGTNVTNNNAGAVAGICSGYGVGGRWLSGSMSASYRLNGVIYEILVYNSLLTTIQRQKVEGYLAHKWGLQTSLPANHPHKTAAPTYEQPVFVPTLISGNQLWLDGVDTSSLTLSGSSVTSWTDKSGFNNSSSNQSLGTTITYPGTKVNGLNTVNFTAGCIRGAFNGSSVINTTDVTIFIVTAETAPNDNVRMFSLTPAANYQDDQASNMLVYCAPGNYQLTFFRGGAMPTPYTVTQNVPFIYSLTQTSGTGSMWLNGGSNRTASITTSAFAVTNYNIGTQYLANQNYTGLMCEVVVYNTLLNTTQRQRVEGYLAQKWGLHSSLPANHPYKTIAPTGIPRSITIQSLSALFNNSSITVPSNSSVTLGTNNHTIEFWMYQTSRGLYDCPFQYSTNTSAFSTNSYYMAIGGYIGILIGNGSGGFTVNMGSTVSLPSLNEWHHYAIVRNGTTFTLYINGISRETATSSINITAQAGSFIIGDVSTTTNTPLFGYITNFRLVNGTAVYTSNFTPPTSPLTAIPNTQVLIQGLVDRSPNAFTVTSTGSVTLSTSVSPFV